MGIPRAKKNKQRQYHLTESQINRLIQDTKNDAVTQTMILVSAYLMEEPALNCNEDKVCELWESITKYSEAVNDHLITIQNVCRIIEQKTGLTLNFHRKVEDIN